MRYYFSMKTNTILIILGALVIIAVAAFLITKPQDTTTLLDEPTMVNLQDDGSSMTEVITTTETETTVVAPVVEPVVEPTVTPEFPVTGVKPE